MMIDRIILIDDDTINNFLNSHIIHSCVPEVKLDVFTNPEDGLAYIISSIDEDKKSIVLLDIRMPELNGWEVLEKLTPFAEQIKKNFRIYMLTTSIDSMDHEKSDKIELVTGFFEKPLKSALIKSVCESAF